MLPAPEGLRCHIDLPTTKGINFFFIQKNPIPNLSQWKNLSGFRSHLILSARVSSSLPLQARIHFSLPPWKARLTHTKLTHKIVFLLQLCLQHLFCGWAELLSAMLSATHLSWSLIKENQKEVKKMHNLFLPYHPRYMFRTSLTSLSFLHRTVVHPLYENSQPSVWKTPKGAAVALSRTVHGLSCAITSNFHKTTVLYCDPSKAAQVLFMAGRILHRKDSSLFWTYSN